MTSIDQANKQIKLPKKTEKKIHGKNIEKTGSKSLANALEKVGEKK